jgi:hypothetical protein
VRLKGSGHASGAMSAAATPMEDSEFGSLGELVSGLEPNEILSALLQRRQVVDM